MSTNQTSLKAIANWTPPTQQTQSLTASAGSAGSRDRGMRYALAQQLGQERGDQETYDVFGWDRDPEVEDYYASYLRNPYTRAVVDIPVNVTWRDPPNIVDNRDTDADETTEFEDAVEDLVDEQRLWHYAKRADKLSGIGEYGVLVLEFDDISSPEGFATEVTSADNLTGLRPFSQASVDKIEVGGPGSGRWGEPMEYTLDLTDEDDRVIEETTSAGPDEMVVHHSRVIHLPAEELLDDEIRSPPRAEPVWNNLTDIQRTMGSAAEVAWRASAWGLNINLDKDYRLTDDGSDLRDQLQRWYYGLEPFLRTQGADVNSLGGEDIDPQPVLDANIQAISAQTGIPQSVLKGNETGERATTQDLKEFYGVMQGRREQRATPVIARELLDRNIQAGVLPDPPEGYVVEWDPLAEASEKEIAETQAARGQVIQRGKSAIPAYGSEEWLEYLETGEFPDIPDNVDVEPMDASRLPDGTPSEGMEGLPQGQQAAVTDGGDDIEGGPE